MNNRDVKYYQLSMQELDLATRLIKFIAEHEYDEFWTITQCNNSDLPNLLVLLDVAKQTLLHGSDRQKIQLNFVQDMTLNRVFWYAYNFDDFFAAQFAAEFDDIYNFYNKLNKQ